MISKRSRPVTPPAFSGSRSVTEEWTPSARTNGESFVTKEPRHTSLMKLKPIDRVVGFMKLRLPTAMPFTCNTRQAHASALRPSRPHRLSLGSGPSTFLGYSGGWRATACAQACAAAPSVHTAASPAFGFALAQLVESRSTARASPASPAVLEPRRIQVHATHCHHEDLGDPRVLAVAHRQPSAIEPPAVRLRRE